MHLLISFLKIATVALIGGGALCGCSSVPKNTLEVRRREAVAIPPRVAELAPFAVCQIFDVDLQERANRVGAIGSGVAYSSSKVFTASHVFRKRLDSKESFVVAVDGQKAMARIEKFQPVQSYGGDWMLLDITLDPAVKYDIPDGYSERLNSPLRRHIRFDGTREVAPGTTLYAIGYIDAPEKPPTPPRFTTELAIIPGTAVVDSDVGPVVRFEPNGHLDSRGASGGPVAVYDAAADELVVVGILVRHYQTRNMPEVTPGKLMSASRLPADVQ